MIRKRKQKSKDNLIRGNGKRRRIQDVADEAAETTTESNQDNLHVEQNAKESTSLTPTFVKGASSRKRNNAMVQSTSMAKKRVDAFGTAPDQASDASNLHSYQADATSASKNNPSNAITSTNAIHAGNKNLTSRAHLHIRSTATFDFGGICKDYKESGWCSFGDDCIYAHVREDYMEGYEQDRAWEKSMKEKKEAKNSAPKNLEENLDAVPQECSLCEQPFKNPVKTLCNHIFCKDCFLKHYKGGRRTACPTCKEDTHGILNSAEELVKKAQERRDRISKQRAEARELAEGADKRGQDEREFGMGWSIPKSTVE
mmetsp:Transcript_10186/g.37877  ORF Transcript_10186/g.37877 Transcript_10186/m.37877 type:complete len:314 (-) Transcript_10186:2138-3079(-)